MSFITKAIAIFSNHKHLEIYQYMYWKENKIGYLTRYPTTVTIYWRDAFGKEQK